MSNPKLALLCRQYFWGGGVLSFRRKVLRQDKIHAWKELDTLSLPLSDPPFPSPHLSFEVLVARGGGEQALALPPPSAVRPVHHVQQAVGVVVVLVPDAPDVLAPAQIIKLHLHPQGDNTRKETRVFFGWGVFHLPRQKLSNGRRHARVRGASRSDSGCFLQRINTLLNTENHIPVYE